jgi:hypothetical protein
MSVCNIFYVYYDKIEIIRKEDRQRERKRDGNCSYFRELNENRHL